MNGERRMEKKMKILAFAAVALMFVACFIGFVAINDGEVDAGDAPADSSTDKLAEMYDSNEITFAEGKYTLNKDATVTLKKNVVLNGAKFVGGFKLTIKSDASAEKPYILDVTYDFEKNTEDKAGRIFQVSSFVLDGANLKVTQKDT